MTEREFIINSDSPQSIRSMKEAGYRELVRCKDCGDCREDGYCERWHFCVRPDFFCADGDDGLQEGS